MGLPPGFLDELRSRVTLGRVVGRKVSWDLRKSNQAKGDLWAACPFHQEKSASFHVDDRKGFYYCFGCHAKGDAIRFVQETENVSFIEAVGVLAREAGMAMPAEDPREAERASRAKSLADVMEMAVQHYRLGLASKAGEGARAYLRRRGLQGAALERWEVGWASDDRTGLFRALTAKGVGGEALREAGLTAEGQGGDYDRFAGRVIFPIRDPRGRAVALGGRSLDPGARAKYLNSPQTPLFDKGRTLFNHGPAREAAGKGARVVVAEGYMDVIALVEAGFPGAVAPLGTAITEDQLAHLWRMADEPVVALDGDAAGRRAALRLVDLALPRLEAGKGLRFALLPGGQDPDELIRARGRGAMEAVLEGSWPMVRLLWDRETEGRVFDSPERRAALDKALRAAVGAIRDPLVRRHYGEAIRELRWALWGPRRAAPAARRAPWPRASREAPVPTPAARASALAGGAEPEAALRGAALGLLLAHPGLAADFAHDIEALDCPDPEEAALRDALLGAAFAPDPERALRDALGGEALERRRGAAAPALRPTGEVARLSLAETLAKLAARRSHAEALREAEEDIAGLADEWLTRRLSEAAASVDVTRARAAEDSREVVVAPNGLALDKGEAERASAALGAIDFTRGGRGGHRREGR